MKRERFTNTASSLTLVLFPCVAVAMVRDRKMRTALRTNQIAGLVTVPFWEKKIKESILGARFFSTEVRVLLYSYHYKSNPSFKIFY